MGPGFESQRDHTGKRKLPFIILSINMKKKLPAGIFLIGLMGAGKSYWGKKLAEHLGYPFYDLDAEIELSEGKNVSEIFTINGEAYFRKREQQLLHELAVNEQFIISCGGGTPCFYNNMDWMKNKGGVLWLNPSLNVIYKRLLINKLERPLIAKLSNEKLVSFLSKMLQERSPVYSKAHCEIKDDLPSIEIFKQYLYDL